MTGKNKADAAGQTLRFNTGRWYGPGGQEIQVEVLGLVDEVEAPDVSLARFADLTRGIYGQIKVAGELTQEKVMAEYDAGRYECISTFRLKDAEKEG